MCYCPIVCVQYPNTTYSNLDLIEWTIGLVWISKANMASYVSSHVEKIFIPTFM